MKKILLAITVLLPFALFGQGYIDKHRKTVKKGLLEFMEKNKDPQAHLTETDSTIHIRVEGDLPTEFIYRFDKKDRCISQYTKANCDSCYRKYLRNVLDKKEYGWVKINENQYVSDYKYRLLLELPGHENVYHFMILRTSWSKDMYKMILNQ